MHQGITLLILLLFKFAADCQVSVLMRYRDFTVEDVMVEKNIVYQDSLQTGTKKKYQLLDLYQPAHDTATKRPLIIWIHGGGFKWGSKTSRGIPLWSSSFARRGYVCVAINYRLTKKKTFSNFPALVDGCYGAIEDLHKAVAFLKINSKRFNIDTNQIILAGNSAGGMVALQACYSSFALLAKKAERADSNSVSRQYNPLKIAAIINMWGAIFDLDWLTNAHVPIVSIHGSRDRVVPINTNGNTLYGSYRIHKQSDELKIANRLKIYEGYGHELQKHFIPFWAGAPVKRRWREAGQFAADFLYETLFK